MAFQEERFPDDISYESRFGPGFRTTVIEMLSGQEERVSHWSQARRRYEVSYGVKNYDDLAEVIAFYTAMGGPATGFRFRDWTDYTTNPVQTGPIGGMSPPTAFDELIGTGTGSQTDFQLVKRYTVGNKIHVRKITKPVESSIVVSVDGSPITPGTQFTVNNTTGIVTILIAPANGFEVKAGCEFDVPVRFGKELDETFAVSADAFASGSIASSIPLIEILDEDALDEEFYYGGAQEQTISADITITHTEGRAVALTPTANNLKVKLPNKTTVPLGGEHFYIGNNSGTHQIQVMEHDGTTGVATIPPSTVVEVILGYSGDGTSTRRWYAF